MKKLLGFQVRLIVLGVLLIVAVLLIGAGSVAPRRGLVVNKLDGTVIINTHPQQPMELNPWQQPRLVIHMDWYATNKHEASIVLSFLSMAKKEKLCAGLVIVNNSVIHLGQARHSYKVMKSGVWEAVYVPISFDTLKQLAFSKMPLKFRVCGAEFFLHKYEGEDLRQAVALWERW